MREVVLAALLVLATGAARGEEASPRPVPSGYAFDEPHFLTRQLLWGVVHGIRLLGRACFERGDMLAAMAYADWIDRQKPAILAAERDLARNYFGRNTASPDALAAALNLNPFLKTSADELAPACATLPAALAGPRYDLERLRAEHLKAMIRDNPDLHGAIWSDR